VRRQALAICLAAAAVAAPAALGVTQPKKAIRAADQAVAQSIVLKRADLPAGSWKGSRSPDDNTTPNCKGMKIDLSDLTETGDANGLEFQDQQTGTYVSSGAGLMLTEAQAKTWYSRFVRPQLAHCLGQVFESGFPKAAKARIAVASRVGFPHVAQDVSAYRVAGSVSLSGRRVPIVLDVAIMHHGRGDAIVLALGIGKPFAPFRSLATLVGQRLARA